MSMARAERKRVSPFQAGFGVSPPVLAGRDSEKAVLETCLQRLRIQGSGASVILTGPRGNGKTVLLKWLASEGESANVASQWMTPNEASKADELVPLLGRKRTIRGLSEIGVTGRQESLEGSMRIKFEQQHSAVPVAETLLKRVGRRPFMLLVDEAHTLTDEVGQALLNATQRCLVNGAPLLLVLAGTPDIEHTLSRMNSSFWSRSRILGVGLMDDASVLEAIERPLSEHGIRLGDRELGNRIAGEAQGYPYFVQLLGDALWDAAVSKPEGRAKGKTRGADAKASCQLAIEDVRVAFKKMSKTRQVFYETRLEEIYAGDLMHPAVAIMNRLTGSSSLHREQIQQVLKGVLGSTDQGELALVQLQRLGFIWSPPGNNLRYEPGIPSFFSFLTAHRAARHG